MSEAAWTAAYAVYGARHEAEFDTLAGAVAFAVSGTETWSYAVDRITGPDGQVIEGDELNEAELHWQFGDEDYDRARAVKWGPLLREAP
ncbi:hypothetical protein [Actinomadura luteofluorescens]|uniref:hypothetical protein n=1 Tax=Actinomadura luteofluorescens TaxID=46163 RepID=UPI003D8FAEB2